jgi:hypothetical protein
MIKTIKTEEELLDEACQERVTLEQLQTAIGGIRNDIREIMSDLGWIVSRVRVVTSDGINEDALFDTLTSISTTIQELDSKALKINDTLAGDSTAQG